MEIVNRYVNYVNIALIILAVIILIVFLTKLLKMTKRLAQLGEDAQSISKHIDVSKEKLASLEQSSDSWDFLGSIGIIYIVLKDTLKYRKRNGSFSQSLAKSCNRHSKALSRIKL